MLKAGYVLCQKCGAATDEAFYLSEAENLWLQLKRTASGRFFVERYIPERFAKDPSYEITDGFFRFELSKRDSLNKKGLLYSIRVNCYQTISSDSPEKSGKFNVVEKTFKLSCPYCNEKKATEIFHGLGNLPTYVIAVVGARTVGKSSLIKSMTCSANLEKIREISAVAEGTIKYALSAATPTDPTGKKLDGTDPGSMGVTNIITISKKIQTSRRSTNDRLPVANVLLLDFAGEIFAEHHEAQFKKTAAHFFSGGDGDCDGYNGVDAILFVTDPFDEDREDEAGNNYSLGETFRRVRDEHGLLNGIPFAFVYNKVDLLFKDLPDDRVLFDPSRPQPLPEFSLVCADTFEPQSKRMYCANNIIPRVALETYLARKLLPIYNDVDLQTRCAGFFVKTAEFNELGCPDYSQSINILDPLLWVLNELDIFPIN